MYLWIGCKLPTEYKKEIRSHCLAQNKQIGLDTVAFELPQHISLKISFPTDRPDEILAHLSAFLSQQKPFSVHMRNPEPFGNILWMTAEENEHLQQLHRQLDTELENRFGIVQHEFDTCFQFHSTLFIDPDQDKIARMHHLLDGYPFDRQLTVDTFLLGQSESGKAGTFRVVRTIKV